VDRSTLDNGGPCRPAKSGHCLDLREHIFDKYVNLFLDFSVSPSHVVPVIVDDFEDAVTGWLVNGQGSVDLLNFTTPKVGITFVVAQVVIEFPISFSKIVLAS
jgi:hypothetical protein